MGDDRILFAVPVAAWSDRVERILDVFEEEDGALWRTLEAIADGPHRELQTQHPVVDAGSAHAMRSDRLMDSILEPDAVGLSRRLPHFEARGQRWRFLKVVDERQVPTTDTLPNRVCARLLRALVNDLRRLIRKLERAARIPDIADGTVDALADARYLKRRLSTILERTDALRDASPIEKVPRNNLVLRHDPRYRRVMQAYVDLLA